MLKQLKKARLPLILAVSVGLAVILMEAYLSIVMMETTDAAMAADQANLWKYVMIMGLVTLAILPMNILMAYLKGRYKMKSMRTLKRHYLKEVFKKDIASFDQDHTTDYVSNMTQDMTTIENGYVMGKFEVIYQGLSFIFGLAVIVYVSPWIPVVGALLALFVALVSILLSKPIKKHQEKRSDLFQKYTAYIKSCLNAFHIIKVNDLTDKAKEDFHNRSEVVQRQGYIIDKINTYIFALQNFMMTSLMIGMMAAATYLTIQGKMTFGGIVLVINSAERVLGPVQVMGEWLPKISSSKILFKKMDKQIEKDRLVETYEVLDQPLGLESAIRLKNVSFAYNEETDQVNHVLEDIDLDLTKGGKYLITGPSGGGKSTLLKLLRKYHQPTGGAILIDDKPLDQISHEDYYHLIANVEQHVFLFEDSLRQNLCLYKDYSDQAIERAVDQAGLKDLVERLPQGLDTKIVDNGKNLSGGEKSRIAIARALLQQAQVLILDEAFASLDDHIAKAIEKTILGLEDLTLINVSHVCFDETKDDYHQVFKVAQRKVA